MSTELPQPNDTAPTTTARVTHRQTRAWAISCPPGIQLAIGAIGIAATYFAIRGHVSKWWIGLIVLVFVLIKLGFVVLKPNEAVVLTLFGRYSGSITDPGLWWVNPFTGPPFNGSSPRRTVSLRINNFQSDKIKVNDSSGNPIEIAAVIVWRVVDTAACVFDVQDFEAFVTVQSETALRHLAALHPYDDYRTEGTSLRQNPDAIHTELQTELQERLAPAGLEVIETRLTHLAYAPEIAETMLRRQQAEAILAARTTMVKGAVGLVHMALAQLAESDLVELDTERKATMVSNLMVVLSGDQSPMPVINTGTLYS